MPSGVSLRNPGRRSAELHSYAPLPFETHLSGDLHYRELRYNRDRLERKVLRLQQTHAPESRLKFTQHLLERAQQQQLEYLVSHAPPPEQEPPTELVRELGPDGQLESEAEEIIRTPVMEVAVS